MTKGWAGLVPTAADRDSQHLWASSDPTTPIYNAVCNKLRINPLRQSRRGSHRRRNR